MAAHQAGSTVTAQVMDPSGCKWRRTASYNDIVRRPVLVACEGVGKVIMTDGPRYMQTLTGKLVKGDDKRDYLQVQISGVAAAGWLWLLGQALSSVRGIAGSQAKLPFYFVPLKAPNGQDICKVMPPPAPMAPPTAPVQTYHQPPPPSTTIVQPQPPCSIVQPQPVQTFVQPQPVQTFVQPQPVQTFVQPQPVQTVVVQPQPVQTFVQPQPVTMVQTQQAMYQDIHRIQAGYGPASGQA